MALTTDVITEYAFAKSYDQLDSSNFQDTPHEASVAICTTGHFGLHFLILFPVLDMMPEWLIRKMKPEVLPLVGLHKSWSYIKFGGFNDNQDSRTWRDKWER